MQDKIVQITNTWAWRGSWEDSDEIMYGLGASGTLYVLSSRYEVKEGDAPEEPSFTGYYWKKVTDSPNEKV